MTYLSRLTAWGAALGATTHEAAPPESYSGPRAVAPSGSVILVDADLSPIPTPSGTFFWDPAEAQAALGSVPERGYGLPAHEVIPADAYEVVWSARHGTDPRWWVFPKAAASNLPPGVTDSMIPGNRPPIGDYDPPCPLCGHPYSDHPTVQVILPDGNDYETNVCPDEAHTAASAPLSWYDGWGGPLDDDEPHERDEEEDPHTASRQPSPVRVASEEEVSRWERQAKAASTTPCGCGTGCGCSGGLDVTSRVSATGAPARAERTYVVVADDGGPTVIVDHDGEEVPQPRDQLRQASLHTADVMGGGDGLPPLGSQYVYDFNLGAEDARAGLPPDPNGSTAYHEGYEQGKTSALH